MFLSEKELKQKFWDNYNYGKRAICSQFDIQIDNRAVDLMTLEKYQEKYQLNAFEFMLTDVKRVIFQAKGNIPYVTKSWIVMPMEKSELLRTKYINTIQKEGIGVIVVEEGGRWQMIVKPKYRDSLQMNQNVLDFIIGGIL